MNIPEQAVQAACAAINERGKGNNVTIGDIYAMIEAAAPHLAAVQVKKLEWGDHAHGSRCVSDQRYDISTWMEGGKPLYVDNYTTMRRFGTLEEAKAAAQADYDARILSAIETVIPVSEPSCAKIEAARKAVEELANVQMDLPLEEWSRLSSVILSALEPSAARELALEEIIALCRDYGEDSQPDSEYRLACNDIIEAIQEHRALSSPDHADAGKVEGDGWLPIESAPKDGTEFIGWDGKWAFRCSAGKKYVLYSHMDGGPTYRDVWDGHYYDSLTIERPTHWRPLPTPPAGEVA